MGNFKICDEEIKALQEWAAADKENRAVFVVVAERNKDHMSVSCALQGLTENIVPALSRYMLEEKSLSDIILEAAKYYLKKKMANDESKGN